MSPASSWRPPIALLTRDQLRKKLQNFMILVGKGVLALAVYAQRPARGHRTAHESLDACFLINPVISQIALSLIEIGHQQRLAVADYPATSPLPGNASAVEDILSPKLKEADR